MVKSLPYAASTLTLKGGGMYTSLAEGGATEGGTGVSHLRLNKHKTASLQPFVGASISHSFTTDQGLMMAPEAGITYKREVLSTKRERQAQVSSQAITIPSIRPSKDTLSLKCGLNAQMNKKLDAYVHYTTDLNRTMKTHTLALGLKYKF